MHGIYNYIPETIRVSRVDSVAAVLYLPMRATCNVVLPVKYVLYSYISTFRSMCVTYEIQSFGTLTCKMLAAADCTACAAWNSRTVLMVYKYVW